MKINDVLSGALTAAFAIAIFLGAQGFPAIPGQNVGPKVFPELIAAGFMVCAVMLIRRGLRTRAAEKWLSLPVNNHVTAQKNSRATAPHPYGISTLRAITKYKYVKSPNTTMTIVKRTAPGFTRMVISQFVQCWMDRCFVFISI